MTASASSLVLPTLTPKTLRLAKSKPTTLSLISLSSSSLKLASKRISIFTSFSSSSRGFQRLCSRFVRNVAVSSEFEQEEEVLSNDGRHNFSPDLKLFVGNLPFNVDSAQLAGLFGSAGNVQMVEVIYDKVTGRSRGFGFVTMSTVDEVEAATQQFNGYEFEGRPLRVNSGPPPPRREDSFRGSRGGEDSFRGSRGGEDSFRGSRGGEDSFRGSRGGASFDSANRVHVGNLAWGVDNLALETLFSEQGNVLEAKVVFDRESGRSRGFGFVTYSSREEVNSAVESLDGADLNGRSIRVTVAEGRPPRRQF